MGLRRIRPCLDLAGSTLVQHSGNLYVDRVTGMVLSRVGCVKPTGYEYIHLSDGREDTAHRVVWEAINGPIPQRLTINHLDGVKTNNRPENLELATQSEQKFHAYRIGLMRGNNRTGKRQKRRLTDEQVAELRSAPRGTVTELAETMGIARSYAYQIRSRRRCSL